MSARRAPARFPAVFYVATPLLAALLTLAVVEASLVHFAPVPFASEHNLYYQADPVTGYRHRPHSQGRYARSLGVINAHGHRDDETSRAKPPGVVRILALGDSFTAGANVDQDEPWPQVLEHLLRSRIDPRIEVINAGVGGWNPLQYAAEYEHRGRDFDPDLVVLGFFVGNDSYLEHRSVDEVRTAVHGRRVDRATADGVSLGLRIATYERSHLVRLLLNGGRLVPRANDLAIAGEPRDGGRWSDDFLDLVARRLPRNHGAATPERRARMAPVAGHLERIRQLAVERGEPLFVLLIPDEVQVNAGLATHLREHLTRDSSTADRVADLDLDMPQAMLHEMLGGEGLQIVDPLAAFRADPRRLFMNDTHWTPAGHRLAAEIVFDALRAEIESALAVSFS
ncbi:MAG: GDSL-type esterase/lipase family protein [Acidobacteriota bacterium]